MQNREVILFHRNTCSDIAALEVQQAEVGQQDLQSHENKDDTAYHL
jgi:hypothetical protein